MSNTSHLFRDGPSGRAFGLRLRRPAAISLCLTELVLGAGLLLTAGLPGSGSPALLTRTATALLFAMARGMVRRVDRAGAGARKGAGPCPPDARALRPRPRPPSRRFADTP